MRVGFIGLGHMGAGMAANLLRAGHEVTVYNRTPKRPEAAAAGRLFIVAAGAPDVVDACQSLFVAMGQRTFAVGHEPKTANLVKLSGNFLIASVIEALGEALALVRKAGIDGRQYIELLTSTLFTAPLYKAYGGQIADGRFEPAGFA